MSRESRLGYPRQKIQEKLEDQAYCLENLRLRKLHFHNSLLTESEERYIVDTALLLGASGYGIDKQGLLSIVNQTLDLRATSLDAEDALCSMSVVDRIMKENQALCRMISVNSLDTVRDDQTTEKVRDSNFVKLDLFVNNLHSRGRTDKKSFRDFDSSKVFNADEVSTDTLKRMKNRKVLTDLARSFGMNFERTYEGDHKMAMHVTLTKEKKQ